MTDGLFHFASKSTDPEEYTQIGYKYTAISVYEDLRVLLGGYNTLDHENYDLYFDDFDCSIDTYSSCQRV